MSKNRPFGVTFLAILGAIGAIIAIFHTLQMLHLFPIRGPFGNFAFFTFSFIGAILWGVLALIYIWVVRMLWNLDPRGWLFAPDPELCSRSSTAPRESNTPKSWM